MFRASPGGPGAPRCDQIPMPPPPPPAVARPPDRRPLVLALIGSLVVGATVVTLMLSRGEPAFEGEVIMESLVAERRACPPPHIERPRPPTCWPAPPAASALERSVALHLSIAHDGDEPRDWDIESHVRKSLRRAGVDVDTWDGPHGTVRVSYDERAPGTELLVTLSVADPDGRPLGHFALEHSPRAALRDDPAWHWLGVFAAASLGIPAALDEALVLCAHPAIGRQVRDMLVRQGFAPDTARKRAYFLVAEASFGPCAELGEAAVEPIERHLELCTRPVPFLEAVGTLGSMSGPRVSRALVRALAWSPPSGDPVDDGRCLYATLHALGHAGDGTVLDDLRRLAEGPDPDVADAARKAERRLLARLQQR